MKALFLALLVACIDPQPPVSTELPRYYGVHLCAAIGCDGTQSVPLWCQSTAPMVPCFCASPMGADEWCLP